MTVQEWVASLPPPHVLQRQQLTTSAASAPAASTAASEDAATPQPYVLFCHLQYIPSVG